MDFKVDAQGLGQTFGELKPLRFGEVAQPRQIGHPDTGPVVSGNVTNPVPAEHLGKKLNYLA